jgi:hypothetical protein
MSDRALDRWITGGLILYALAVAAALLLTGVHPFHLEGSLERGFGLRPALAMGAANLTYDDGFYYLKIAERVARGDGSTFDGINPTNGYHPLWLICLLPIFWLTSAPDIALIVVVIVQAVMMSIGAGLTYRIARFGLGRFGAVLGALLWVACQLPYRIALSGLEYGLQALCILSAICFFGRLLADEPPRLRTHLLLGTLLALTFLARLDSLVLFGCIALALGLREARGGLAGAGAAVKRLLALSLPVAGAVVLYLGTNLRMFGHPLPINGVIKRDWSARMLEQDPRFRAHGWLVAKLFNLPWELGNMKPAYVLFLLAGSAGVAGVWLMALAARRPGATRDPSPVPARTAAGCCTRAPPPFWGALVLFSVLQLSLFQVVYHDGYSFQRWYYVIQPWLGALLFAAVAERTWQRAKRLSQRFAWARCLPALVGVLVFTGVPLASARSIWQWHDETLAGSSRIPLYAAGQWVGANLPRDAVVGSWNAGMVSYLSGRRVVNLDGLVNSWDFYRTKRHDLCEYWKSEGVTYLVDVFELDHELAFINTYYAPGVDLSPCASRLERVWVGPAPGHTLEHAIAFKLRRAPQ